MQDLLKKYRDFIRHGYPTVEIEDVDYEEEQMESLTIEGWVARDKDGYLALHRHEPERNADDCWTAFQDFVSQISLPDESFQEITWDSGPQKVSITITFHK